ncbi:MAG TPA: S-methyl-5-thioribose-1-phosphate isomerase, partial [Burkholderiaceae bacterium]|nr:S-methyl-5-thioribose-1-phosphate isomerase [Burkholderiaceae bacterium]
MKVRGQAWRSIWVLDKAGDHARLGIIDQTRLPYAFETLTLNTCDEVVQAIGQMRLRGAPLIGVAGAFALALALREDASDAALAAAAETICASRPPAVNLR